MPVTALHRYYGRSDSCLSRLFGADWLRSHEHRSLAPGRSLWFT